MRQDRIACDQCNKTTKATDAAGWIMVNLREMVRESAETGPAAVNAIHATDFCSLEHLEAKAAELRKAEKAERKGAKT